jgi:hypothetical protein
VGVVDHVVAGAATLGPEIRPLRVDQIERADVPQEPAQGLELRRGAGTGALHGGLLLIIQGFRDVLFPFNQGVKAAQCIQKAQHEVHLIGVQGGHLQPFAQHSPLGDTPFWYIGKSVACGNQKQYKLQDTIMGWFDQKLKDQTATIDLPELCVDKSPVYKFKDLDAKTQYTLNRTWIEPQNSQAVFVPIHTITELAHLTGTPQLNLKIETPNNKVEPTLFISMAIKSEKTGKYAILNDQTTALNPSKKHTFDQVISHKNSASKGNQTIELPSINGRLNKGDTLGLLIQTESIYYQKIKQPKIEAWISGQITLPKFWSEISNKE